MTVLGTVSRVAFNCTGGTAYPLGASFLFINSEDLVVVRISAAGVSTVLTETTDYSVSGGDGLTGTVTTVATYSDGQLVVYRDTAIKQTYDAERGDGFNVNTFERALDRMVMSLQEMASNLSRTLALDPADTTTADLTLPTPTALKVIGWNAAGDALENKTVDLTEISSYVSTAAASATAAGTAQGLAETAQGLAETAQTAAEAAQGLAETAQSAAEAAAISAVDQEITSGSNYIIGASIAPVSSEATTSENSSLDFMMMGHGTAVAQAYIYTSNAATTAYLKVLLNGIQVGSTQSTTATSPTAKSITVPGIVKGDIVSFVVYGSDASNAVVLYLARIFSGAYGAWAVPNYVPILP